MPKSIVVPLDGSPLAEKALPFAAWLHRATGAKVTIVRALPTVNSMFVTNASAMRIAQARQKVEAQEAQEDAEKVVARLRGDGMAVALRVRAGEAGQIILEEAAVEGADLIIMFTHGRSATLRFLFGSIADEVLLKSEIPVLVISPNCLDAWPTDTAPRRVLVPLDGSTLAEEVLPFAADFAHDLSAELILLRVMDSDAAASELHDAEQYLEGVVGPLRAEGTSVRARSLVDTPASGIAHVAREEGVCAVAMATHGRGGLARVIAGSVTTATVRDARVPVLVFRPAAMRFAALRRGGR